MYRATGEVTCFWMLFIHFYQGIGLVSSIYLLFTYFGTLVKYIGKMSLLLSIPEFLTKQGLKTRFCTLFICSLKCCNKQLFDEMVKSWLYSWDCMNCCLKFSPMCKIVISEDFENNIGEIL